jgi:hypothetical protein
VNLFNLEKLRAPDIVKRVKFRGLIINGYLSYAYIGSNVISVPQLKGTASLIKGK